MEVESAGKRTHLLAPPPPPTNYGTVTTAEPRPHKQQAGDEVTTTTTTTTTTSSSSSSRGRGCCQLRLLLYAMIFLAGSISYALRVSLSQVCGQRSAFGRVRPLVC